MRKSSTISFTLLLLVILVAFRTGDDFVSRLQAKLSAYYEAHLPVKLYVHLNQPQYVPGDTLLYKVTLVSDALNRAVGGREIVFINLVDESNVRHFSVSVLINNGTGAGALVLPLSLPPGLYMLQAYHKTMLNVDEPRVFQQPVVIGGDLSFIEKPYSGVEFFPETGNVVDGATNRIVVHASPLFTTAIFENDKLISSVQCDSAGWGEFYFVPAESKKYYYGASVSDRSILPVSISDDVAMLVSGVSEGTQLRIALQSSDDGKYDHPLHLVCSIEDEIIFSSTVDFRKKKRHSITFTKSNLRTGVYALTLFTDNGGVVSERLLYLEKPLPDLTISTDKDIYNVREPVTLSLALPEGTDARSLAVKVYQEDLFPGPNLEDISFKQFFNRTASLPDAAPVWSSLRDASIDRFMISQTRRNFSWDEVWSVGKNDKYIFEPYQRLTGKAFFKSTGEPVPDSTFIQFFFEKEVAGYQTYTRGEGEFSFPMLIDFYGEDAVHFSAEMRGVLSNDVKIVLEDITVPVALEQWSVKNSKNNYSEFMMKKQMISAAYFHSKPGISVKHVWLNERIESAVGGADATFVLSDYILFPTMHETLREIIPAVKSRENKKLVRVWLIDEKREAPGIPLCVIDGVLTDDIEYFLSLNPAVIETIKVVNTARKLNVIGGMARNGILLVDTRIPDHELRIPVRENVFPVYGLTVTKFNAPGPVYKKDWREPDLRSCLYWNPDVKVTNGVATLTLNCADNTGKFRVVAEGLTTDGQVLAQSHSFTVSFKGH